MIKFDFSSNNSITEFENTDTESYVYLGFSSQPETNIFSWKYFRSPYGSTTETLIKNYELLNVSNEKDYTAIIHLVQGWATLDVATAAMAVKKDSKELRSKDWFNLANYISEMEKGFTTPPFLRSLYSFYYATVGMVSQNQQFIEVPNCLMKWVDPQTAKVLLPGGIENDFIQGTLLLTSGAKEETCNDLFRVLQSDQKELMICRLPDYALKNLMGSVEDPIARSLMENMHTLSHRKELKAQWEKVISSESKLLPDGDKVKLNDFYKRMNNQLAWETDFNDQQIRILGEDKLKNRNLEVLTRYHEILEAFLKERGLKGPDAYRNFMDLIPSSFSITAQEEILNTSKEEFIVQDYLTAEEFEVDLPLKSPNGNQTHQRVPLLGLVEPQSSMFKFFARNPMSYPGSPEQKRFPLTYVHNLKNKGKASEHIISVPPSEPYNLKGLSELLEKIEDRSREEIKEKERPKDKPRPGGYKYNDPWYDERQSNYSIIDNPTDGSRLERLDMLEAIWHFGNPLERIKVEHATISIFIPFWEDKGIDTEKSFYENNGNWIPFSYKNDAKEKGFEMGHAFLPFVEEIFNTTHEPPTADGSLQAWSYNDKNLKLNLEPEHIQDYGPSVNEIREIAKNKVNIFLQKANADLRVFSYEYGLGLINVEINFPKKCCSIMDTQWLEHLISITNCKNLLGETSLPFDEIKILVPYKHYACSTLSQFEYAGGSMNDCRSLGGGLKMVVNDAEPLFHNLPKETQIITDQTIVDEVTKRHFYCSSSSMLNFDEAAFRWEHTENHTFASMLFNMVLSQRFILAQSRKDIVEKEWGYNKKKKETRFGGWLKSRLKTLIRYKVDEKSPEEEIRAIRDQIQHMTTSSWFNVVSSDSAFQAVFEKLRDQMNVNEFYIEVQERCNDLDEFIAKKQASVQSRVFDIFTFVMSPLSLVVGFMGGKYFTRLNEDVHPFPFLDLEIESGWLVFLIYGVIFSILFLGVWILYKYKSFKA